MDQAAFGDGFAAAEVYRRLTKADLGLSAGEPGELDQVAVVSE